MGYGCAMAEIIPAISVSYLEFSQEVSRTCAIG